MSDQLAAFILGLVQGLTEFLPVSSTAHLILVSDALKLDPEKFGLTFDVALHLGTALAVLLYFAGTWVGLLVDVIRGRWRVPLAIVVGTIPAAIAGVLFESTISTTVRSTAYIAVGLLIGSAIFVLAERADATRFAFLLATPIILGAGLKTLLDARKLAGLTAQLDVVAIGFVVSFVSGFAAVAFLVRYLRTHSLRIFVIYRVVLAIVILVALALGALH